MKKSDKTEIRLSYGSGVSVLPASAIDLVDKAKKFDLKVLLLISSSEKYREGKFASRIAERLSCGEDEVHNSIAFWNGAGVIDIVGAEEKKSSDKPRTKASAEEVEEKPATKRARQSELPIYSSSELNALLEKHKNAITLIDECQNILGKIFTASDIKVIMALIDYLGLDNDYILVLMHHCAEKEIKSIRYIEKMAVSCVDEGFTEAKVLEAALYEREEKHQIENRIRGIFGIGTRKLTAKEKKQVETWIADYKFGLDVIEKAYEITVGATNKPSIHYANAILEKWYSLGAKGIDDVNALLEAREQEKSTEGSSFNVDDFFDAALKRSYDIK